MGTWQEQKRLSQQLEKRKSKQERKTEFIFMKVR